MAKIKVRKEVAEEVISKLQSSKNDSIYWIIYDKEEIQKSKNHYETQPRSHGKFASRGIETIKAIINEMAEKNNYNEKQKIEEYKERCKTKYFTPKGNMFFYEGDRFEPYKKYSGEDKLRNNEELINAITLADNGFSVYMPLEMNQEGKKKFDAVVNDVIVDFKYMRGDSVRTLESRYQEGLKQAPNISYYIPKGKKTTKDDIKDTICRGAKGSEKEKGVVILYFEDENKLYGMDVRNLRKDIKKSILEKYAFMAETHRFQNCENTQLQKVNSFCKLNISQQNNLSSNFSKSMFTDWKIELYKLCNKKGLDYDSIIQKYDSKMIRFVAEEQLKQDAENVIAYKAYKDLNKSLSIDEKLFNLWQRRLSPELCKEMLKIMNDSYSVFHLVPAKVYKIEGYPKGQDLENCELIEFADTYFIISCGGDWQDEKLVKFEIGNDDKLHASVVDDCKKEDRRVLKKKVAYILNPESIKKSLFNNRDINDTFSVCPIVDTETVPITVYSLSETPILSSKNVKKSLTYSGHKLQGRTRLYGMDISIENKKGSYRSGVDKDGHKWKTLMHYDYGYIRGTVGTDKDHLDCYVGSDKEAQKVYVIHQNDPVTHKYDEDKCMLCFSSAADAKAAYMKQYDRPGFYGSMTTMTIEQFKSFIFSHKGKMVHKSFDINITDITENNKQQKLEQVNKALNAIADNRPFMIKHIPADASTSYGNLLVRITDFDRNKIEKAVHKIALSLDADISGASKGESFVYKAQEELTDKYFKELTNRTRAIYNFVIDYFDLPDIRIVSKAGELRHKGKILYNPESGLPIKEADWKKFVVELEKYLNRNYTGIGKKIVLSAESLGIILDRLSKTNSFEAMKKMSLAQIKAKRYDVDWISESVKNMEDKFGDVISRERQARIQVAIDSAAQRVTSVSDDLRNNIQQIIIDGVRDKQSKSVVAQNLFDKCASLNRDMQRIADTEIQMAATNSYIKEEVYNTPKNEKVYFKRFEMMDANTCKKCRKINGTVVLWSDVPLPDEHIKDEYAKIAIWEGKTGGDYPESVCHPYCRGTWIREYPDV